MQPGVKSQELVSRISVVGVALDPDNSGSTGVPACFHTSFPQGIYLTVGVACFWIAVFARRSMLILPFSEPQIAQIPQFSTLEGLNLSSHRRQPVEQ